MIMMDFSGFTEMLMLGFFMRGRHGTYPNGLTALELFQNRQSSLNALEHYQSVKVHDVGTESDDALTLPYQSLVNKAQNTSYKVEAGNYLAQALLQGCYPRVFIDTETGEACVVPAPVLEEVGARLDEIAKAAVLPVVTRGAEKFDLAEAALKQQYPNLYGMMNKPEINLNGLGSQQRFKPVVHGRAVGGDRDQCVDHRSRWWCGGQELATQGSVAQRRQRERVFSPRRHRTRWSVQIRVRTRTLHVVLERGTLHGTEQVRRLRVHAEPGAGLGYEKAQGARRSYDWTGGTVDARCSR